MNSLQQEVITIDIEDGEIVDEFEYILSSEEDEEVIAKKIQELEARNDELERIEIVATYSNYPTSKDFEISDYEDNHYPPRVNSRDQKSSRRVLRTYNRGGSSIDGYKIKRKLDKKRRERKKRKQRVTVQQDESASSSSEEDEPRVSQDILRYAVETQNVIAPNKRNLKDRLILNNSVKEEDKVQKEALVESNEADEGIEDSSIEEQELRLMALKSAILNRHSDRVKRKKDLTAYSPSDFDAVLLNQSPLPEEGVDTPTMDISPIASPASIEEDVQAVDMDIENSDDETPPVTQFQQELVSAKGLPKPEAIYQEPDNGEEEEEALRALLLSKLNSAKMIKKSTASNDENEENTKDNLELSTAALILKRAVQRLQQKKLYCDIFEPSQESSSPKHQSLESDEKVLRELPEENQRSIQSVPSPLPESIPKAIKRNSDTVLSVPAKKSKTKLITTVPNHKVKKLVINLENDEDVGHWEDSFTTALLSKKINSSDSINYTETAINVGHTHSTQSSRANSPLVSAIKLPDIKKQITNDVFEARLDNFLKNVRSKVEQNVKMSEAKKSVQRTPMVSLHSNLYKTKYLLNNSILFTLLMRAAVSLMTLL